MTKFLGFCMKLHFGSNEHCNCYQSRVFPGAVAFAAYTVVFLASDVDTPMKLTFSIYLGSAVLGMVLSATFHIFACHSPNVCSFFQRYMQRRAKSGKYSLEKKKFAEMSSTTIYRTFNRIFCATGIRSFNEHVFFR